MSLTTTISVGLKALQQLANDNFATPVDSASFPYQGESWASGTGASQADLVYRARRTLAGSTADNLDVSGSLTDKFGNTLTMARVKLIAIFNRAAIGSGFDLNVGAGANPLANLFGDAASDKINVKPQGLFLITAPGATAYAVTAATGDILKINNGNGSSVDYDILIVGASA